MTFVSLSAGVLLVERNVDLDCVLDVDPYGDLIGIEFLSPRAVDPSIDWKRTSSAASLHVAYDEAADAVYVRVTEESTGDHQLHATATLHIDARHTVRLISIPGPRDDVGAAGR
jgi:uncharacterized protein YuzE